MNLFYSVFFANTIAEEMMDVLSTEYLLLVFPYVSMHLYIENMQCSIQLQFQISAYWKSPSY